MDTLLVLLFVVLAFCVGFADGLEYATTVAIPTEVATPRALPNGAEPPTWFGPSSKMHTGQLVVWVGTQKWVFERYSNIGMDREEWASMACVRARQGGLTKYGQLDVNQWGIEIHDQLHFPNDLFLVAAENGPALVR